MTLAGRALAYTLTIVVLHGALVGVAMGIALLFVRE